jgi:hypothetical protein
MNDFEKQNEQLIAQAVAHMEQARSTTSPEETARGLRTMGVAPRIVDAALERLRAKARAIEHWRDPSAITSGEAGSWYSGPGPSDQYWPRVRARFAGRLSATAVEGLDRASTRVVSCLHNPHSSQFATRGLVAGDVQSGKTSNFTATIAKAADAGFRLFIVLSGTKNKLRRQTQERMDDDLCVPHQPGWIMLTTLDSDFRAGGNNINQLLSGQNTQRIILVAKKHAGRLQLIANWLKGAAGNLLASCPTLIIDDEADEASINTAAQNARRSRVNAGILSILSLLPRAAYVGYTATPYANFFIDASVPEDLYPGDFILNLSAGGEYFGYEAIFGREPTRWEGEEESADGLNMIRAIPDQEARMLRPGNRAVAAFALNMSSAPSLADAIRWFLLATAVRIVRGQGSEHSSMLVHTSQRTAVHQRCREPVERFLRDVGAAIARNDQMELDTLGLMWEYEQLCVPPEGFAQQTTPFQRVLAELPEVIRRARVVVENSMTLPEERLLYGDAPGIYIVIGGDVLSRGLTLAGLVASYFTRTASAYDTLMQMGRWFGYRTGYGDLPRIWMTDDLRNNFYDLASIDREMRQLIELRYAGTVTPRQYAPLIRTHPRMMITSRMKMGQAQPGEVSYWNEHLQTIHLYRSKIDGDDVIGQNRTSIERFLDDAKASAREFRDLNRSARSRLVLLDVDHVLVQQLLDSFRVHPDQADFSAPPLRQFIADAADDGTIGGWNVAVICAGAGSGTDRVTLAGVEVGSIRRSRMDHCGEHANIKALMSRQNVLSDCTDQTFKDESWEALKKMRAGEFPRTALLLIYPIDSVSPPGPSTKAKAQRIPLDADDVVFGLGIVFPPSPAGSSARNATYMTQDLSGLIVELPEDVTEDEPGDAEVQA